MPTHQPEAFASLVAPLNEDQSIDWESLESLVEVALQGGDMGVRVGGSTGVGSSLPDRKRVNPRIFDAAGC